MKKVVYGILGLLVVVFLVTFLSGYSLVIHPKPIKNITTECDNGRISPFGSFDFSEGNWEMTLVISNSDINELPADFKKGNCFKTNDVRLLTEIKNNWKLDCSNGKDVSTVESKLYLFNNNELVFESGIVINNSTEGLQNSAFGWVEDNSQTISKDLKKFNRVYYPIILL